MGGLNLPVVLNSWQSFKISWLGRLHKTKAAWGNIFMEYVKEINPFLRLDDLFANSGTFDLLTLQKYQVKLLEGSNCSS